MPATPEIVRALISRGEGPGVEFETRLRDTRTLARLISALGNANGGVVLVGVGDRGEVMGTDSEEVNRLFHSALESVVNAPRVDLEGVALDGKHVAVITVGTGDHLVMTREGAFTRTGSTIGPTPTVDLAAALQRYEHIDESGARATAQAIHDVTSTVEDLSQQVAHANSFRVQVPNYKRGYAIVSGGTDSHLMLVDLRPKGLTGKEAEQLLDRAGITVNKNTIPGDPQSPFVTSGIRLGTSALTTRGFGEGEMERVAELIDAVLTKRDEGTVGRVKKEVRELADAFPLYAERRKRVGVGG